MCIPSPGSVARLVIAMEKNNSRAFMRGGNVELAVALREML
jgi:hypothetical protein